MELVVIKRKGQKGEYLALALNLGYALKNLSFDVALMSEVTRIDVHTLQSLKVDERILILKGDSLK